MNTDMNLTPEMFLIVCPMLFLAGLVDAIGGGGGLISLPAYLFAGLPIHAAIATNKLSSTCGTALATFRFIRHKLVNFKLAVPSVICAVAGASLGARLSMRMSEQVMKNVLFIVLPLSAFFVLNKTLFQERGREARVDRRTYLVSSAAAFVIGIYDGFYGPGSGTFMLLLLTGAAHMKLQEANATAKVINFCTCISSLTVYLLNGKVMIMLGLAAGATAALGSFIGTKMFDREGARIVKPLIIIVIVIFLIKLISELFL